jgi:acetoin utilization deacetylase AcuC-like enzyme
VRTASVHVDPGEGWFPHFLGFAVENDDSNLNLPVAPGSGDAPWLAGVREAAAFARDARALVVALGVDAATADPESPLAVTHDGYGEAGRILGGLGVPTVVVQEGGYDLGTIGDLVVATLTGLVEA